DGVINLHQRTADRVVFLIVDLADSNCVGHLGQPGRRNSNFFSRIKSNKIGGTRVTARIAAMAMEKFLVKARGLKSRPSCASKVNTGRKETAITSKAKKLGPP